MIRHIPTLSNPDPGGNGLVVPSPAVFEAALAAANTPDELLSLDRAVTMLKAAAERSRVALDVAIRVASYYLTTRRKVGALLLQVDGRGGDRTREHAATLLEDLLRELGRDRAKRYRAIARIPEPYYRDYLSKQADSATVPTAAGLVSHARKAMAVLHPTPKPRARRSRRRAASRLTLPPTVLETVRRFLGDIDVCLGEIDLPCRSRAEISRSLPDGLRGTVFVALRDDAAGLLPELAAKRLRGDIQELMVVFAAASQPKWTEALSQHEWDVCFLHGVGPDIVVAYRNGRNRAFELMFSSLGLIARTCEFRP